MPSVNHLKKEKMFHRAVSLIISEEIKNVNISHTTVTDVKLSGDGSHLKIFVSFENHEERSLENLRKTKGFVRTSLSKRINLRKIPELHFEKDESIKSGKRIDEILNEIKNQKSSIVKGFVLSDKKDMFSFEFDQIKTIKYNEGNLSIEMNDNSKKLFKNIDEKKAEEWIKNLKAYKTN